MQTTDYETLFSGVEMHGIFVNRSSMEQALKELDDLVSHNSQQYVCFFEGNLFSRSLLDGAVREALRNAAVVYPDGVSVAKAASLVADMEFERVPGPSFILRACEYGVGKNWRHFFLGGAEGVAEKLAQRLQRKFPGIQIAGTYCPPFRKMTEEEEAEVKKMIEESHADLLWVGLGGPKQEFWMNEHQGKIHVPVMLGVGAAFDFHTNRRPWAPKLIRRWGLEWLWRMLLGGRKTFVRNIKCVSHIALIYFMDRMKYKCHLMTHRKLTERLPKIADEEK